MPDEAHDDWRTIGLPLFCLSEIAEPAALDRIIAPADLTLTDEQRAELGVALAHDVGWFLARASATAGSPPERPKHLKSRWQALQEAEARSGWRPFQPQRPQHVQSRGQVLQPADVQKRWQGLADAVEAASDLAAKTRGAWPLDAEVPGMTASRRDFMRSAGGLRAKALQMVAACEPIVEEDKAARLRYKHLANAALDGLVSNLATTWRDATGAWPGVSDGGPFSRFIEAILVETRRALAREVPNALSWRYPPSVEAALTATPGAIAKRLSRLNRDKYPERNF